MKKFTNPKPKKFKMTVKPYICRFTHEYTGEYIGECKGLLKNERITVWARSVREVQEKILIDVKKYLTKHSEILDFYIQIKVKGK